MKDGNLAECSMSTAPRRSDSESASTLRTLNAFAVDVMSIQNADDLFWYVARNVVGQLNFVDCVIYQASPDRTELVQVAALGEKNPYGRSIINPLRIPFGQGITGRVAQDRSPIIVDDLLVNQNYIPDTQPARSEVCVPLISGGDVVGVIDSEHPNVAAFGEAELEVLTTVAAMTSAKLELLEEAERSRQRYRDLVQSHAQLTDEIDARKALEAELFQSRKLEAIGRLTGGFAHGFNNLLTVISGNLDLIEGEIANAEARECHAEGKAAVERAAGLIRDMLAFSQQARLRAEAVDLNALVTMVCERDGRGLVEAIELNLSTDLPLARVDPAVAGIALINLMMNARDAMVEGGTLRIETATVSCDALTRLTRNLDLAPGRYVRLSVTDEGNGIEPAVLQRIFDPFYTTKPVGHGTGLGLSMVQGFMKQSGGAVMAGPAGPGGTTFDLYFPIS